MSFMNLIRSTMVHRMCVQHAFVRIEFSRFVKCHMHYAVLVQLSDTVWLFFLIPTSRIIERGPGKSSIRLVCRWPVINWHWGRRKWSRSLSVQWMEPGKDWWWTVLMVAGRTALNASVWENWNFQPATTSKSVTAIHSTQLLIIPTFARDHRCRCY